LVQVLGLCLKPEALSRERSRESTSVSQTDLR
jgi:hypothetical protein